MICWDRLLRFCWDQLLRWSVGSDCKIICWDQLLRLSVEFICWDQLLRFSVQLLFRNSQALRETGSNCAICNRQKVGMGFLRKAKNLCICWVYLLRSLVKILCSTVEIVYLGHLLRLCVDNIRWDYLLRTAVEIICWNHLVRLSVEFICWDQLLRLSSQLLRFSAQISCWSYVVIWFVAIRCWDLMLRFHMLRLSVEFICWGQLLRSSKDPTWTQNI